MERERDDGHVNRVRSKSGYMTDELKLFNFQRFTCIARSL